MCEYETAVSADCRTQRTEYSPDSSVLRALKCRLKWLGLAAQITREARKIDTAFAYRDSCVAPTRLALTTLRSVLRQAILPRQVRAAAIILAVNALVARPLTALASSERITDARSF